MARDWRSGKVSARTLAGKARPLPDQVTTIGCPAQMANSDACLMLNPEFSLWLMGFPPGWLD
jgi:hypothetical protein